jgi:ribose transport system substrate-binding protein
MGLVLQDPFQMGYKSVITAVAHLRGEPYEKSVDTGVFLATPENRNDPLISRLLKPDLSILD